LDKYGPTRELSNSDLIYQKAKLTVTEVGPKWPPLMIRTFIKRRRVKRLFRKLIDAETVKTLQRDDGGQLPIKQGRIEFVLAFVRGESPLQISERMARVADIAAEHGAVIYDLVGGLVIVAFGTHPNPPSQLSSRASVLQALRQQLAGDVKIVHGVDDGHYGLFGNGTRTSHTFVVPKFDQILGTLSRLKFGEVEEFR
jgi:hypothetical protein